MDQGWTGRTARPAAALVIAGAALAAGAAPGPQGSVIAAKGGAAGALACVTCHGAQGEGNAAAGFPRLAGLAPAYLAAQLDHFAAGQRHNPVMAPIAQQLTAAERQAVAAYYGGLRAAPPLAAPATAPTSADKGAWLVLRGRWDENLPACVQCHGAGSTGVGTAFPALAGQSPAYLLAQLQAFKAGTRPAGPLGLMKAVADKLSDADMGAVADYLGRASTAPAETAAAGGAEEAK